MSEKIASDLNKQEEAQHKKKWKEYRESINWGPDGWPIDVLSPPA